jgi:hypothetical protein
MLTHLSDQQSFQSGSKQLVAMTLNCLNIVQQL